MNDLFFSGFVLLHCVYSYKWPVAIVREVGQMKNLFNISFPKSCFVMRTELSLLWANLTQPLSGNYVVSSLLTRVQYWTWSEARFKRRSLQSWPHLISDYNFKDAGIICNIPLTYFFMSSWTRSVSKEMAKSRHHCYRSKSITLTKGFMFHSWMTILFVFLVIRSFNI